ncbi:MAG TPA: NAD(P)/FAD-dependent oxidoreductase [Polyangia bacterium]|nr:NAD(P)/FAD-dependent oxidoreductase [Polyangia bacterium]
MPLDRYDVIIAGAGPAGIATAVALSRHPLARAARVLCLDRARFPRAKPCGGGLTGHAQRALADLGLEVRVPRVACHTGRIVYGALAAEVRLPRPVDIVRREEFDADLVAQARARGIEIVEGEGVEDLTVPAAATATAIATATATGEVTVRTTRGRALRARVLVGADGVGSRVRRALLSDQPRAPHPLRLFKAEIPAPAGVDLGDRMIYDFSAMDAGLRGYVWMFPVSGGRLNVGAMHYPSRHLPGAEIDRLLRRTLARHGVVLPAPARGWPAWPYDERARIAAPHLLCVGDAAGIDALTGEGIAVGLEQGIIAADTIASALARGDFRFGGYAAAVRRGVVGRELTLDSWAAAALYPPSGFSLALSMVLFDAGVRELYAARVSGSAVLADKKPALVSALARHAVAATFRLRRLAHAERTRFRR